VAGPVKFVSYFTGQAQIQQKNADLKISVNQPNQRVAPATCVLLNIKK